MVFLRSIVIWTICAVSCNAAAITNGDDDFTAVFKGDIYKKLPKPKNEDEHAQSQYKGHVHRELNIDEPTLKKNEDLFADVQTLSESNKKVIHSDKDSGHEIKVDYDYKNKNNTNGARFVMTSTPTTKMIRKKVIENRTQQQGEATGTKQQLKNGSIYSQDAKEWEAKSERNKDENLYIHKPDKDHKDIGKTQHENHNSSFTTLNTDITERKIDLPLSNINVKDINSTLRSSQYNNSSDQKLLMKETPGDLKIASITSNNADSEDKTIRKQNTDIVRETPLSTVKINDKNNEEESKKHRKNQNESTNLSANKNGSKTVHEKNQKDIKQDYLQHSNTFTFEKIPKLETATPIKVILTMKALDNMHYASDEKNEKEIRETTPTSVMTENWTENQTSKYNYDTTPQPSTDSPELPTVTESGSSEIATDVKITKEPNNEQNETAKNYISTQPEKVTTTETKQDENNPQQNSTEPVQQTVGSTENNNNNNNTQPNNKETNKIKPEQKENTNSVPETASASKSTQQPIPENTQINTTQPETNKKNNQTENNSNIQNNKSNYGTLLLTIPREKDSKVSTSEFIDNVAKSEKIKNFLKYIKDNKLATNVIIAGPLETDPDNYDQQIQDYADDYQRPVGVYKKSESKEKNVQEDTEELYLIIPNEKQSKNDSNGGIQDSNKDTTKNDNTSDTAATKAA